MSVPVPICPYCKKPSQRLTGASVYPHRKDLAKKIFYVCAPCDARVGCHPGTVVPLGIMANAEHRAIKSEAHRVFDQLWKSRYMTRSDAYSWMRKALGLTADEAHIGKMCPSDCRKLIELVSAHLKELERARFKN